MNLEKDSNLIFYALNMWANYIETGNVALSKQDAINCKYSEVIKKLSPSQMELTLRLRKLSEECFNAQ